MNAIRSNQTLILAGERSSPFPAGARTARQSPAGDSSGASGSNAARGSGGGNSLSVSGGSSGSVLEAVHIVTSLPDDTLVYVRADYGHQDRYTPSRVVSVQSPAVSANPARGSSTDASTSVSSSAATSATVTSASAVSRSALATSAQSSALVTRSPSRQVALYAQTQSQSSAGSARGASHVDVYA